jgi:hypothetical protein
MDFFETLLKTIQEKRRREGPGPFADTRRLASLYEDAGAGDRVAEALEDPFFALSLYLRHHLGRGAARSTDRAAQDLALLAGMFLKIRKDIARGFGNKRITCVDLDGDAFQPLPADQWCTFCGECCQLSGTIPDPAEPARYPGYWYAYIAGDGPLLQAFCPFLFELPPQGRFFCSIHHVKPKTCLAFDRAACEEKHLRRPLPGPYD